MNRLEYQKWNATPKTVNNTYELIWEADNLSFKAYFYECIFQINTDRMWIKVEVDDSVVLEEALDELHDSFNLRAGGDDDGASGGFSIQEYKNRCWHWKPPTPILVDNNMKIYMKSSLGNKRIERGRSVWGQR